MFSLLKTGKMEQFMTDLDASFPSNDSGGNFFFSFFYKSCFISISFLHAPPSLSRHAGAEFARCVFESRSRSSRYQQRLSGESCRKITLSHSTNLCFFFLLIDALTQSKVMSPLAVLYSTSTMEHHHLDQCIMILSEDSNNILQSLSPEQYKKCMHLIEHAILSTDLAIYFRKKNRFITMVDNGVIICLI